MAAAIAGLLGTILGAVIGVVALELQARRQARAARRDALRDRYLDWIFTQRHIVANLIETPAERLRVEAEMVLAAARLLGASDASAEQMVQFQHGLTAGLGPGTGATVAKTSATVGDEISALVALMRDDLARLQ